MKLTINGHSTAMFSSWYLLEELGILFDAGDGIVSSLLHKVHKINHVFVSHAHRDHLSGLQQTVQLGALQSAPVVYYPRDSQSFVHLSAFAHRFDDHAAAVEWKPIGEGERIFLRDDLFVETIRNGHVDVPAGVVKSLSFKVQTRKRKLKQEFAHLPQAALRDLILEKGRDFTTDWVHNTVFGYSADTPVEDMDRWTGTEVLIHEATFMGGSEDLTIDKRNHQHSTLPEVIEMAAHCNPGKLILGHFSSRYSHAQILERIVTLSREAKLGCPVWAVLPGETVNDIMGRAPVYQPS